MNRFLIFLLLFPAVATASFYAVTCILTGAAQDSGLGPVFMYLVFIVPGLLVALLDWLVAKTSIPAVIATTLLTYGLSALALAWALGSSRSWHSVFSAHFQPRCVRGCQINQMEGHNEWNAGRLFSRTGPVEI
jgi:hypothetical protein